jgi:hypothetical protein
MPSLLPSSSSSPLPTSKLSKFQELLSNSMVDMEALRHLSWSGIPDEVRACVWKLLMGYLPCNINRREATLARKRAEYRNCMDQYFGKDRSYLDKKTYQQVNSFTTE